MNDVCSLLPPAFQIPLIPSVPLGWFFTYVLSPLAALIALGNLGLAVPLSSVGRLIQGIFTQPGLLFLRYKRKGYGQVFESLSKRPMDLALVRIIDAERGRVVGTRVTDAYGRFLALMPAGTYRFAVSKPGYEFPSRLLAGEKFDPNVGPIYTGGLVEHKSKGPLEVNLPIDGPEDRVTVKQALRRQFKKSAHVVFAYGGLVIAALAVAVAWTWQSWALLGLQLLLFLLFERLTYRPYGRPWGSVTDRLTRAPLARSVVRILDTRFNRVLETAVTDRHGQYSFIVGKNKYRLFADRTRYTPYRGEPFEIEKRYGMVKQPIGLHPGEAPSAGRTRPAHGNPAALY